ncbi:hypothetical protein [Devosia sp.]|uniref:hypothetical protein n=1 Tax=Devosia sp. TaxID=1871048 RepID=UPI003A917A7F
MLKSIVVPALVALGLASPAMAQITGFSAMAEVQQGARYEVRYEGTATSMESIGFAPRGGEGMVYSHFGNAEFSIDENPVRLYAPETPGEYDVVVSDGGTFTWRLPVTVTEAYAELTGPAAAERGRIIEIAWTGPDGFDDEIRIARQGDPDTVRLDARLVTTSPMLVQLPDEDGTYELRYAMGETPDAKVIGRMIVTVSAEAAYAAELEEAGGMVPVQVPSEVAVGAPFAVGHDGLPQDWQAMFVTPGESTFLDGQGSTFGFLVADPLELTAPSQPGAYQLILLDPDRLVRARVDAQVVPATARLEIAEDDRKLPAMVVRWQGPGGNFDRIGLFRPGEEGPLEVSYVLSSDDTVYMDRPSAPGTYELRYLQSLGDRLIVLATLPYILP